MKKLLALVLALVMTLSLAVVGSNAAFKDAKDTTETYAEAVDVLSGMGVFNGYKNADGTYSFQPKGEITRAEVAAIVYRLYTADVTDKQASLYATYNKFNDMNGAKWAAGYIGYCANAGLVKGYDAKTFGPANKVTGYEALAMILRAIGYDKNDEFTGAQWQLRVASTAQQLGILQNVKGVDLNAAATRELVAELLFRTATVPMVSYTPAFGYVANSVVGAQKSLGEKNFGLTMSSDQIDTWGRPYYTWYGEYNKVAGYQKGTKDVHYATVKATPVATYNTAVTECKVAEDYGFKATKEFTVYTNGAINAAKKTLNATNTVATVGGQGTVVEVYKNSIVVIDTLLAEVVSVTPVRYDAAKHIVTNAKLTLNVFDANNAATTFVEEDTTDFTYVVGDMLLVNAVQKADNKIYNVGDNAYIEILGKSESFVGAQTRIQNFSNKHTINNTEYFDNARFHLDQATTETINHNWWLDQFGNLIGATDIISNNYAVLKYIRWNPSTAIGVDGYGEAVLVDMDGNESTVKVAKIDGTAGATFNGFSVQDAVVTMAGSNAAGGKIDAVSAPKALVSHEASLNTNFMGYALYRVDTNMDGTVSLTGVDKTTTIVNYLANASFSTNGSYISTSSTPTVAVSANTKYLVRVSTATGFDYKAISGTQAIASYKEAELFYVDYNNDKIADYVYIKNGTEKGSDTNVIYVLGEQYDSPVGTKNYYSMEVLVNGVKETVKVNAANAALITDTLHNNVGKLFVAQYNTTVGDEYGYLTSLAKVTYNNGTAATVGAESAIYVPATRTYDGYALRYTEAAIANTYTIPADVKVYNKGTEADRSVLNDYNVLAYDGIWVVYKTVGTEKVATAVYVGSKLNTATALTITATEGGVVAPKASAANTSVFTNKLDATSDKLSFAYSENATVTGITANPMTVTSTADTADKTFTVKNEEGTTTTTYKLEMKWDNKTVVAPVITLDTLKYDTVNKKFTVNTTLSTEIAAGAWDKYVFTIKSIDGGEIAKTTANGSGAWSTTPWTAEASYDATTPAHPQSFDVTLTIYKGETVVATQTTRLALA